MVKIYTMEEYAFSDVKIKNKGEAFVVYQPNEYIHLEVVFCQENKNVKRIERSNGTVCFPIQYQ